VAAAGVQATKECVNLDLDLSGTGGGGYYGVVNRFFLWILVDAKGVEAGSSDIRVSRVYPAVNGAGIAARWSQGLTSCLSSAA
jgi:hypothetical protein